MGFEDLPTQLQTHKKNSAAVIVLLRMDVESLFTSGEGSGKGVSVSVWQAEVALRLSEFAEIFDLVKLATYIQPL